MSIEDAGKYPDSLDLNEVDPISFPAQASFLLIVDAQERLVPAIDSAGRVTGNLDRLLRAADLLAVPVRATEHCADAIGPTLGTLHARLGPDRILAKRHFDALAEAPVAAALRALGRPAAIVAGVEAHVCVAQSVLGLLRAGYRVGVVEDACGSRHAEDRGTGLARLRAAGAVPLTVESVVFDWLGSADHPAFRTALGIVKEV